MLAIPRFEKLFDIRKSKYLHWKVFYRIIKTALKKFEFYHPHHFIQKLYLEIDPIARTGLIYDNFEEYLKGIIAEDQINIIPSVVIGLGYDSYTVTSFPERRFRYDMPYLREFVFSNRVWWANTLIKRPFFEEYIDPPGDPTDRCAVYYMTRDKDSLYGIFEDQCYVELCRYIVNMKKNIIVPNLSIEVFQGLEEDMQRIDAQLETTYMASVPNGAYLL